MGEYYSPGKPVKSGSRYAYLKVPRAGLVALTVVALTLLFVSCGSPTPADSNSSLTVSEFLTTDGIYADVADWDMSVQDELGDEYRVADWDDFLAYHNAGEDLLELILDLDNRARIDTEAITSFFVTSRGGKSSGSRLPSRTVQVRLCSPLQGYRSALLSGAPADRSGRIRAGAGITF